MNEKKVIAVIVEGPSDEAALGTIIKEFFSGDEIQFVVIHGDITVNEYTYVDNIVKKIGELIDLVKQKYGYKNDDFLQIIHIVDTDGAFIKDEIIYADVDHVLYYEDRIETNNIDFIKKRNNKKSEILSKLCSTNKIHDIRYQIYFNSCNLEHVLYNKLADYSDEEKQRLADDFAERFENKAEEFIELISKDTAAVPGNYKETWKFIEKDGNSLKRHTNMHLIFV